MKKVDKKDKKILGVLNTNARASVTEVAKKTGLPRDSVHYRIQRLIKIKVIDSFHTIINPLKLGYPIFSYVNFILHNLDEETEKKFFNYLEKHPQIIYVAKTIGKWDCISAISAKNLEDFDNVLKSIRKKFPNIIKEFETASIIKQYKYDYMVDLIK